MTLDVVCDLVFRGDETALSPIKAAVAEGNVYSDRNVESLSVLHESDGVYQIFFTTRYEDPRESTRLLAKENPNLSIVLTYEDGIGSDGRIEYNGDGSESLDYEGPFRKELAQLVADGKLPEYGVILSSDDEDELGEAIINFAAEYGFQADDDSDMWSALDWLTEYANDFGSFEVEDDSLAFRPWGPEEF
jgi:hypothetical protein